MSNVDDVTVFEQAGSVTKTFLAVSAVMVAGMATLSLCLSFGRCAVAVSVAVAVAVSTSVSVRLRLSLSLSVSATSVSREGERGRDREKRESESETVAYSLTSADVCVQCVFFTNYNNPLSLITITLSPALLTNLP